MTREEFDNICYMDELITVASDHGYDSLVEDIYYGESLHSVIDDDLYNRLSYDRWDVIRDWLNEIPDFSDDDFLRQDDYGEYYILDNDDFEALKSELREYFEENEEFDDDYVDEGGNDEVEEDPAFEQGCSFDEMITSSIQIIRVPTSPEDDRKANEFIQMLSV